MEVIYEEYRYGKYEIKRYRCFCIKTLIERGKMMADKLYPNVSYGDLPSKTLTELGKEVLSKNNK